MRRTVVVGVAMAAGFFACKPRVEKGSEVLTNATNPNETAVDVNDLSYLLPRNAQGEIYPEIRVSASWSDLRTQSHLVPFDEGGTNPILTKPVYDSIVAATADQKNFGLKANSIKTPFTSEDTKDFAHESFVITSFRIDPCAPSLALDKARTNYQNPLSQSVIAGLVQQINQEIADIFGQNKFTLSACQTQVRLILQPISQDKKTIKESTIHLVYTLNAGAGVMNDTHQADVQGLKKKLQEVTGIDTTGYLLQPHPGLAAEAAGNQDATRSGPGAQAIVDYLSAVLYKFNNPQVMAVIREAVFDGVQYDVVLGGGVSDPRETATYAAGPLVGSSAKKGFIIKSDANRRNWQMDPAPTRNSPVFDNLITFDAGRIDTPQDSALLNMMKKDDPESTHFFVNDCVTCHGTSQAFREIQDQSIAAATPARYKVPVGVSGFPIGNYLPPPPSGSGDKVIGVALRNFGYSHGQPVIGLRTVTETAALADYFNRDLRRITNPGAACEGASEAKAWVAAIMMGAQGGPSAYTFAKGTAAREDALFESAGCAKATPRRSSTAGAAALGTRGDGANTPKIGPQQSPLFSQLAFEGTGTTGAVSLVLAKMGQAAISEVTDGVPVQSIGQWTYVADTNRVSQIKITFDGQPTVLAMNGYQLCEVPASGAKARFNGCLSIQSGWTRAAKGATQTTTVEFYADTTCSGTAAFKAGPLTDCSAVAKTRIAAAKIDETCVNFYPPLPLSDRGAQDACERAKAAGGSSFVATFAELGCKAGYLIAAVGSQSSCDKLRDILGGISIWSSKPKGRPCINLDRWAVFNDACSTYNK